MLRCLGTRDGVRATLGTFFRYRVLQGGRIVHSSDPRTERALDADIVDWLLGRITSSTLKLGREKPASFGGSVADGDLATLLATDVG